MKDHDRQLCHHHHHHHHNHHPYDHPTVDVCARMEVELAMFALSLFLFIYNVDSLYVYIAFNGFYLEADVSVVPPMSHTHR